VPVLGFCTLPNSERNTLEASWKPAANQVNDT